MHLKAFEVRNYRAFVEPARVELRPLTLLFGYNNAGKSALARVLPLLRDSVKGSGRNDGLPLNLESATVRGAEFSELRSRQTGERTIDLGLEWEPGAGIHEARFSLHDIPETREHFVESFSIRSLDGKFIAGRAVLGRGTLDEPVYAVESELGSKELAISWDGLTPSFGEEEGEKLEGSEVFPLGRYTTEIWALASVLWLGSVRSPLPRFAELPRRRPDAIQWNGEGAAARLAWDKRFGQGAIFDAVARWYEEHGRGPLELSMQGNHYALTAGAQRVNLTDMGEGFTQVLPVLVAVALAASRASEGGEAHVVIEQPELHLHPAAHADLSRFFCERASAPKPPRMLVETHSENFLFGVQLAVAKGELEPARVMIYWVHQGAEGNSTLTPIVLDADGHPSYWPPGVFAEETALAKQLIEARRQRKAT